MARICPGPREEVRPHVPQVRFLRIRPARIRDLIGPGGRHIQAIESFDPQNLRIDSEDVLSRIRSGDSGWVSMVPPQVAEAIKSRRLLGYRG